MDKDIIELEKELNETTERLKIISDTLNKIALDEGNDEIQYGSKVLITWGDGRTSEGRVWVDKGNGVFGINRDGYAKTIDLGKNQPGLSEHSLKNLSVGTYGKLERQRWILTEKINKIRKQIDLAIDSRVQGIKESFLTGPLREVDINRIISSTEFKNWYQGNSDYKDFPLINTWPKILLSAIAKEFLLDAESKFI